MNLSDEENQNLRLFIVSSLYSGQIWMQHLKRSKPSDGWMVAAEYIEPPVMSAQLVGLLNRLGASAGPSDLSADTPAGRDCLIFLIDVRNDSLLALAVLNWLAEQVRPFSQTQTPMGVILWGLDSSRIRDTLNLYADAANIGGLVLLAAGVGGDEMVGIVTQLRLQLLDGRKNRMPVASAFAQMDTKEIRLGLQHDQFELYYQPKIDMADFSLRGTEALLRWQHPDLGLLGPASFLSQAEAGGLVEQLSLQVLKMAICDLRLFRLHFMMKPVAINLSPLALAISGLASRLAAEIDSAGLPHSAILFEITEYTDMADVRTALYNLLVLHGHGYSLSLDDFGAGHGSILQLSRFPFNELKLDKQLVTDAWRRPHVAAMLRKTVQAARSAGILTVAEGIESWQDWHFMRSIGCEKAQGFLIARPMSVGDMLSWSGEPFFQRSLQT